MKLLNKFTFNVAVIFFLSSLSLSCVNKLPKGPEIDINMVMTEIQSGRAPYEAECIAHKAYSNFYGDIKSPNMKSNLSRIVPVMTSMNTKSSEADTLMYIVNFDGGGFALVSYSRKYPAVLAVVEEGEYQGGKTDNPGFNIYIEAITKILNEESILPSTSIDDMYLTKEEIDTLQTTEAGPLCPVHWHQHSPFNRFCSFPYNPNVPAGCVAVAVAQAMAVYSYPDIINLTFEGAPSSTCELDWTGMINDYFDDWPTCDYCFQKAALLREIGERLDMNYAPGGSGAYTANVVATLASFGYESSPVYSGFSNDNIVSSIATGAPVIIEGWSSAMEGHEWIIDGYRYLKVQNQFLKKTLTSQFWTMQYYIENDYYYLHMNFGHGTEKGYFLSLHHAKSGGNTAYSIDDDVVSVFSGTGWDNNLKYICNIKLYES